MMQCNAMWHSAMLDDKNGWSGGMGRKDAMRCDAMRCNGGIGLMD